MRRSDFTAEHIGRLVLYRAEHADATPEIGKIVSMNDKYIFVRYFNLASGVATAPESLEWWLDPREVRAQALVEALKIAEENCHERAECSCTADIRALLEREKRPCK